MLVTKNISSTNLILKSWILPSESLPESTWYLFYSGVSQTWHSNWHFGPDYSSLGGAVLRIVGCLIASLSPTNYMQVATTSPSQIVVIKIVYTLPNDPWGSKIATNWEPQPQRGYVIPFSVTDKIILFVFPYGQKSVRTSLNRQVCHYHYSWK